MGAMYLQNLSKPDIPSALSVLLSESSGFLGSLLVKLAPDLEWTTRAP